VVGTPAFFHPWKNATREQFVLGILPSRIASTPHQNTTTPPLNIRLWIDIGLWIGTGLRIDPGVETPPLDIKLIV
jgi:hypothetical protein